MPSIVTESALETNLAALGERNADCAQQIRNEIPHLSIQFHETPQAALSAEIDGRQLASRHRPLEEAARLADTVDLVEHAVVVVFGFGLGWHVRELAQRLDKAGVIIVVEPDVSLLRAVFDRIDHSQWMRDALLVFVTDVEDRAALAHKLRGSEAILAQGVDFLEHPPSRVRMGDAARTFRAGFSEYITSAKTTLMTTLIRCADTTRNLALNLDHYAGGSGISDLENTCRDFPAAVVSAGPSLAKNIHQLAQPGVRDRCIIIAVQTTLRPLLEAGVRPHFVTALDYHEISRRFYEGLTAEDVKGVTLVADPKAHPTILDSFPGIVRCCHSAFLDRLLGDLTREMGTLPNGATVSHLAVYLARYLGCNPIALVGQDLGFTDGLYYTPGTSIHDVWSTELNPFNTIAMMEWQRIVRHRQHLHRRTDAHGRTIYTDTQMMTYQQQFEVDFAQYVAEGAVIVNATEGGVELQHTKRATLASFLEEHARGLIPKLPNGATTLDRERLRSVEQQVRDAQERISILADVSHKTLDLLDRMLEDQADTERMNEHFKSIEAHRRIVDEHFATFELVNQLNQLGVFRRLKADRKLHMRRDLDGPGRQRAQIERDIANVSWLADACDEMTWQLDRARQLLRSETIETIRRPVRQPESIDPAVEEITTETRIAALVPIDPARSGVGLARTIDRTMLQQTLERLGRSEEIESIILLVPDSFDADDLIDHDRIDKPVEVERCDESPFAPEHEALRVARMWADTSWRGGIACMSTFDEVLCPQTMLRAMEQRGLTAALIVGPDWSHVNPSPIDGCDAVIARHREQPDKHDIVFTQAPPGLCGCVVSRKLMMQLTQPSRLAAIGPLLGYLPHVPQADPIARDANVQIDHTIRRGMVRAIADSPQRAERLASISPDASPAQVIEALDAATRDDPGALPEHIILELTPERRDTGLLRESLGEIGNRAPIGIEPASRLLDQICRDSKPLLTLAGAGDPLLQPQCCKIIRMARDAGVRGIHLRTALPVDERGLDELLDAAPDVISIDLHADRAATYESMMGEDRFRDVLILIQRLVDKRRYLAGAHGSSGIGLPWIVPRLQRRAETLDDVESFFDRWQHMLGTAVIESPPACTPDSIAAAITPARVVRHVLLHRMLILSDGSVPIDECDLRSDESFGNAFDTPIRDLWPALHCERSARLDDPHSTKPVPRTLQP